MVIITVAKAAMSWRITPVLLLGEKLASMFGQASSVDYTYHKLSECFFFFFCFLFLITAYLRAHLVILYFYMLDVHRDRNVKVHICASECCSMTVRNVLVYEVFLAITLSDII